MSNNRLEWEKVLEEKLDLEAILVLETKIKRNLPLEIDANPLYYILNKKDLLIIQKHPYIKKTKDHTLYRIYFVFKNKNKGLNNLQKEFINYLNKKVENPDNKWEVIDTIKSFLKSKGLYTPPFSSIIMVKLEEILDAIQKSTGLTNYSGKNLIDDLNKFNKGSKIMVNGREITFSENASPYGLKMEIKGLKRTYLLIYDPTNKKYILKREGFKPRDLYEVVYDKTKGEIKFTEIGKPDDTDKKYVSGIFSNFGKVNGITISTIPAKKAYSLKQAVKDITSLFIYIGNAINGSIKSTSTKIPSIDQRSLVYGVAMYMVLFAMEMFMRTNYGASILQMLPQLGRII